MAGLTDDAIAVAIARWFPTEHHHRGERLYGKPRILKMAGFWWVTWIVSGVVGNCTGTDRRSYIATDWNAALAAALKIVAAR